MKQLDPTGLKRLHREWRRQPAERLALVLDGLGTPANVGSILRTAAAYRVDDVWLAGATPEPASAGVQRTAMGTDRYLQLHRVDTAAEAVAAAKAAGYQVVGLELADQAVPLHQLDPTGPVAVAVGHEDHGLSRAALEACDRVAYLPQLGRVGSLNVAVATGIALYELRRQGWDGAVGRPPPVTPGPGRPPPAPGRPAGA